MQAKMITGRGLILLAAAVGFAALGATPVETGGPVKWVRTAPPEAATYYSFDDIEVLSNYTYGAAAYLPGTNTLWLAGCTCEENGRAITGIAAFAKVGLKH